MKQDPEMGSEISNTRHLKDSEGETSRRRLDRQDSYGAELEKKSIRTLELFLLMIFQSPLLGHSNDTRS